MIDSVRDFPRMTKIINEGECGSAKIIKFEVTKEDSERTAMRSWRDRWAYVPPGNYVRLMIDGRTVMSDTPMERNTNRSLLSNANGDVLIGGLGIGMVVCGIVQKPEVKSVTIVEISQDVINLVAHSVLEIAQLFNKNIEIIHDDIFTWFPAKDKKFDTIYMDIWTDIATDNLSEMQTLNRRFGRKINKENPDAWKGCWREDYLKYKKKQEKKSTSYLYNAY